MKISGAPDEARSGFEDASVKAGCRTTGSPSLSRKRRRHPPYGDAGGSGEAQWMARPAAGTHHVVHPRSRQTKSSWFRVWRTSQRDAADHPHFGTCVADAGRPGCGANRRIDLPPHQEPGSVAKRPARAPTKMSRPAATPACRIGLSEMKRVPATRVAGPPRGRKGAAWHW